MVDAVDFNDLVDHSISIILYHDRVSAVQLTVNLWPSIWKVKFGSQEIETCPSGG